MGRPRVKCQAAISPSFARPSPDKFKQALADAWATGSLDSQLVFEAGWTTVQLTGILWKVPFRSIELNNRASDHPVVTNFPISWMAAMPSKQAEEWRVENKAPALG